jgi:hypothetical protein
VWQISVWLRRLPQGALAGSQLCSAPLSSRNLDEEPALFGYDLQRIGQALGDLA